MASDFGISVLRSRFDDWRSTFRKPDAQDTRGDPEPCTIVAEDRPALNLASIVESLVIPKLIANREPDSVRISQQGQAEALGTQRERPIRPADVAKFSELAISDEASTLLDFVDNCLATGSSIDDVYVDLLAPAARQLGQGWEDDTRDFVDVTMGLWRIQEVLRELTLRIPPRSGAGSGLRSAVFSTMPGEQHSLGTLMIAECFQRAGWDAEVVMEPTQSELVTRFSQRSYDLVGLTVSNDCPRGALCKLVSDIRSASNNPGIRVMVGGRVINENPALADDCGADGTADDAPSAVRLADDLVPLKAHFPGPLN